MVSETFHGRFKGYQEVSGDEQGCLRVIHRDSVNFGGLQELSGNFRKVSFGVLQFFRKLLLGFMIASVIISRVSKRCQGCSKGFS